MYLPRCWLAKIELYIILMTPHWRSLSKSLDSLYHLLLYDMIFFNSNQNYKIPCLSDDDKSTIFFRSEFIAECMLYFQLDKKEYIIYS